MRNCELLHLGAYHLTDLESPRSSGVGQQQAEFLATIARGKTRSLAGDAGQRFANPGEAGVAFRMSVGVVEQLEVIDVDHQQRQVTGVLLRPRPFEIQTALEPA